MNKIICQIELGTNKQTVIVVENQKQKTYSLSIEDIPNFICNMNNIEEVYISGPSNYCSKIEQEVQKKEFEKYQNKEFYNKKYFHYF